MTQRKTQSQVEEESMLEENRPEVLRMEIESLSRNEEFARVVVSVFMARMNPTLEELDDVKTAVSEAVTNAVIHGYQGNGGIIYLEVKILGQELTVTVKDTGIGIPNIPQAMEPMFTTDPEGERSGMGFSFMEAFMDEVSVESEPDKGTVVTMKKKINR
ncbi:anti-sigma F factor [Hungatella hathewayi DSM 13479]|jgi:stage II sporulation protein AB (anti-sigma F factor)|uniref:Anti-sigma F factor n=2 Tax=Hungatella hathewayi TaxID=154046 RepID=D3ADB8_9FIRM|nr:anti-sigma F factor [Hungatella hathewayi DSM 13479]